MYELHRKKIVVFPCKSDCQHSLTLFIESRITDRLIRIPNCEKEEWCSLKKSLVPFYSSVRSCLIKHEKSHFLRSVARIAISDEIEPLEIMQLLQNAIEEENLECFEILTNFINVEKNLFAFSLVLNSNFECKMENFSKMLSRKIEDSFDVESIIRSCIQNGASFEDLKKALSLFKLDEYNSLSLERFSIVTGRFDIFQFGIKNHIFSFTEGLACVSLAASCTFLDKLLDKYSEVYTRIINDVYPYFGGIHRSDDSEYLQTFFSHPKVLCSSSNRSIMFESLFSKPYYELFHQDSLSKRWLIYFCMIIYYSENYGGVPQRAINKAFQVLVDEQPTEVNQEFTVKLIITLVWNGYNFTDLDMPFKNFSDENEFNDSINNFLINISDQKHFRKFNRVKGRNCLMTLMSITRYTIRRSMKRPFHLSFKALLDMFKLPICIQNYLLLNEEIETLEIRKFDLLTTISRRREFIEL